MIFRLWMDDSNWPECRLLIWPAKKKNVPIHSWVEIRGNIEKYDPENTFHKVHDVKRIDVSQLHCGECVEILPEWEGYEIVEKVFLEG